MTQHSDRTSGISLILVILFCTVAFLGTSLWVTLRHGISLDHITLSSIQAHHISIKVDDGIIFSVDRLDVLSQQTTDSKANPEKIIVRFNAWAHLFREIRINQIRYLEHTYQLLFQDNQFNVTGDNFQLTGTLAYANGAVHMDIPALTIKQYSVTFSGKAIYTRKSNDIKFSGKFIGQDVNGLLTFSKHEDQVNAEINTDNFSDLPAILARFPLDKNLVTWITENITARDYKVEHLKLDFTLHDGKPEIGPGSISGKAIAQDASLRFHPSLAPVQCKQINITLNNDQLSFALEQPAYKTRNLAGSSVLINNLVAGDSQMDINIQTNTELDNEILELLDTYNINLPVSQKTGTTKADIHLVFDLPDFTLSTTGAFTTGEGSWTMGDISFQTSSIAVQLKNNLITIKNAAIASQDIIQTDLTGTIDTAAKKAELTANIKHLNFHGKEKDIITARNLLTPIDIQFRGEEINIHLIVPQVNIALSPSRRIVTLEDLNSVKPFIPSLKDFPFQQGSGSINFTDLENITFEGFIDTDALPLSTNNKPVTQFTFQGSKTAEKLTANINKGKILLTVTDKLHIDLRDYMVTIDTDKIGQKTGPSSPIPISVSGLQSLIKLKNIPIPTRTFAAELNNQEVSFSASLDHGKVLFEKTGQEMSITASEIDAVLAQNFFQFADLEGGRFNLSVKAKDEKNFHGFVEFSNVLIKNFVLLNNVLSFMSVIPSLATLSSPGFDSNGYRVNQGIAKFTWDNKLLTIQQLRTDGTTINTETDGWLNFNNDTLNINLKVISLKDFSKIISKFAWADYAILGKDGSLSTSLLLSGNLHNPEIKTHLTKEIVMAPINIVKRTIQWPFHQFRKTRDLATGPVEPEK